ncbi:MAG: phosphate regulon sensor histidine kinase PhoR [Gammaproteobacteria bacterium]
MLAVWIKALLRIAILLAIAAVLGLLFDNVALWVAIVLGAMLATQYANLLRLQHWIRHRSHEEPPELRGIWGDVVGLVGRLYRRKQVHKRRVNQLLREFRRLSAALPEGVVLLSGNHEILWFNRMAGDLLGLRRKIDTGLPIANLVRQPEFTAYLQRATAGQGVIVPLRGGEAFLLMVVIPAGDQALMLVRDVTREARLEQMRKDFVANASHELRSPLTVISGYLEQLAEDPALGGIWTQPVADMRRQASRMREIVDDLLELSRLEASGEEAPYALVDMASLVERLVQEARAAAPTAPSLELDLDRRLFLRGGESEVHSIVWNLLWNAVKFTPASGLITIRWRREGPGALLAVQDTGIGIAPEHLPRLTERFYRVDRSRARATGGSGLGLAIVKHALQRHGARLEIASEEGRGSTFTAHFGARRTAAAAAIVTKAS